MGTASRVRSQFLRMSLLLSVLSFCFPLQSVAAQSATPLELIEYESQVVYLANQERQALGIPPLRWNRELTLAARAFSADVVQNRARGYCGHEDSLGRGPGERMLAYGFANMATWAENVLCGMASPEAAVAGWMRSDGHREALLDPDLREIGVGYFQDAESGRGFVTMDLSADSAFAPVVINYEARHTSSPSVSLYIYNPEADDSFRGMGPAQEMMISNSPTFDDGAVWEPYAVEKSWQLEGGEGWRQVYVRLRDAVGNSLTASDSIYLGDTIEWEGMALEDLATFIEQAVEVEQFPAGGMGFAQFRLNWMADDTHPSYDLVYGEGGRVNDDAAMGGTAQRMNGDGFEASAVVRTYKFIHEVPLVAYLRLKVADNTAADTLVEVTVAGGGASYGPLIVRADDFAASNAYQFFALPFVYHADDAHPFLEVRMRTEGTTDVFFDAVTFYSQSIPITAPLTWSVPGGAYRGQSVWMRYADAAGNFSDSVEIGAADSDAPMLVVTPAPAEYRFEVNGNVVSPAAVAIRVTCDDCSDHEWAVSCDASWVDIEAQSDQIVLSVDAATLPPSEYTTTIQIHVPDAPEIAPVELSVDVVVRSLDPQGDDVSITAPASDHLIFLPYTMRR